MIVYFKHDKGQLKGLETEKTVSDLFSILDKLHSLNDVSILYDEIGQENVDKITELSNLFIKYLDYLEEIPVYPVKQ